MTTKDLLKALDEHGDALTVLNKTVKHDRIAELIAEISELRDRVADEGVRS
jgi:hypothetical protein